MYDSNQFKHFLNQTTGLDDGSEASAAPRLLEADQGDQISGKVSRPEAAAVIAAALDTPEAARTTFELRRCAGGAVLIGPLTTQLPAASWSSAHGFCKKVSLVTLTGGISCTLQHTQV